MGEKSGMLDFVDLLGMVALALAVLFLHGLDDELPWNFLLVVLGLGG